MGQVVYASLLFTNRHIVRTMTGGIIAIQHCLYITMQGYKPFLTENTKANGS